MLCKIAGAEIEAEDLTWQFIGSPGDLKPAPARIPQPAAAALRDKKERPADEASVAALNQRLAEFEAQQNAKLQAAHQAGIEQGIKQARQEAANEMQSALDRLAKTIQEVAQIKKRVRGEAEGELVKLSLAIARRILHRELTIDPQSLRGVVYTALQRLQNREITRVRVFPAAVPAVKAALERNGGSSSIEVVADGMLPPGGLLFETSLGELDASVDTQIQEIDRGLADRLQVR